MQRGRDLSAPASPVYSRVRSFVPGAIHSPRRSQLEPGLIERGTFCLSKLRRAAVIEFIPWNRSSGPKSQAPPLPKEPRDPVKLARCYQSLLDSGQFENRAALARHLGVSRARVTQVLRRLNAPQTIGKRR
jgi:hypothetical protein